RAEGHRHFRAIHQSSPWASSANHPNIRTLSRLFAAPTLECSDVRLGWQQTRKRVLELRRPVTVSRDIRSFGRMNGDRTDLEVFQFGLAQDTENFRAEQIVPAPLPGNLRATAPTGIDDRPEVGLSVKQIIGLIDNQGWVFAIDCTVYAGPVGSTLTNGFGTRKRRTPRRVLLPESGSTEVAVRIGECVAPSRLVASGVAADHGERQVP